MHEQVALFIDGAFLFIFKASDKENALCSTRIVSHP